MRNAVQFCLLGDFRFLLGLEAFRLGAYGADDLKVVQWPAIVEVCKRSEPGEPERSAAFSAFLLGLVE